jgi:hypothetical protein
MSTLYFLVTAAILIAAFRISRKKMLSLRKEVRQMVPYHDRLQIMRGKVLIAILMLAMLSCVAALFGMCVYQSVLWLAAR